MVSEHTQANASQMADSGSSSNSTSPGDHSSTAPPLPNVSQSLTVKLEGEGNYLAWVAQFQPILFCHDLVGIVDGSEPCPPQYVTDPENDTQTLNPSFVAWKKRDQHLLSWILCYFCRRL